MKHSSLLIVAFLASQANAAGYPGCGNSSSCFGSEGECLNLGNCNMMISYQFDKANNVLNVMMQSSSGLSSNSYIAMGISADKQMGNDLVIYCPNTAQSAPTVAWNSGKSPTNAVTGVTLTNNNWAINNGLLTCNFTLNAELNPVVNGANQKIDMISNKYYLLLAIGPLNGNLMSEHRTKISSSDSQNLTITGVDAKAAEDTTGFKVHGCLMALAWLACAPTGMLLARYYKKTWTSVKPCGKLFWFRYHQGFMVSAVILTLISLIVMLAVDGLDPFEGVSSNPHPAVGLASIICAFLQPIMAAFRPHPGTSNRPIFNWAHRIVGNLALILAIATIFLSFLYHQMDLPKGLLYAFVIWVVLYKIVQIVLSIQQCLSSNRLTDVNGGQLKGDDEGSTFRKVIAFIYVPFLWIFAIAFLIVIAGSS